MLLIRWLSRVQHCDPMDQTSLSFTISWSLLRLMCIESAMPSKLIC